VGFIVIVKTISIRTTIITKIVLVYFGVLCWKLADWWGFAAYNLTCFAFANSLTMPFNNQQINLRSYAIKNPKHYLPDSDSLPLTSLPFS
jgi:hypothetical protein